MSATSTAPAGPTVVQEILSKQENKQADEKKSKAKKKPARAATHESRPNRLLPTERITVEKQLAILRAYAAASSHGSKTVKLEEVANVLGMATTTVSLANPFLTSVGLLSKTDAGFMPASEVVSFLRAHEWNPETSSHKLGPIIERSWFFEAIKPRLSFGPTDEDAIVNVLGETTAAGPDYKKNLQMLTEFAIAAGLVQREGTQLRLARPSTSVSGEAIPKAEPNASAKTSDVDGAASKKTISSVFQKTAEGAVHFNVSVKVEMEEFAGWQPDRIVAFFNGIAAVLRAKAGIEQEIGK